MSKTASTKPSINQKIDQLNESIEWFYSDSFSLDEALSRYEAAHALAQSIEQDLTTLKNKVEVIEDFTKC